RRRPRSRSKGRQELPHEGAQGRRRVAPLAIPGPGPRSRQSLVPSTEVEPPTEREHAMNPITQEQAGQWRTGEFTSRLWNDASGILDRVNRLAFLEELAAGTL